MRWRGEVPVRKIGTTLHVWKEQRNTGAAGIRHRDRWMRSGASYTAVRTVI